MIQLARPSLVRTEAGVSRMKRSLNASAGWGMKGIGVSKVLEDMKTLFSIYIKNSGHNCDSFEPYQHITLEFLNLQR